MCALKQTENKFLCNSDFQELVEHYKDHPIVLYVGAGIQVDPDKEYGVGGWYYLLESILKEKTKDQQILNEYEEEKNKIQHEPWALAQWVSDRCNGADEFKRILMGKVRAKPNLREYGLLASNFLDKVTTLNAVSAFCTQLDYIEQV